MIKKLFIGSLMLSMLVLPSVTKAVTITKTAQNEDTTPTFTIVSPNGGESFVEGQQISVRWNSANIPAGDKVGFDLHSNLDSVHGYSLFNPAGSALFDNDGQETLVIPSIQNNSTYWAYGNHFTITAMVDDQAVPATDISDATFSITPPTVTIISPNGGESFVEGQQIHVTWSTRGLPATKQVGFDLHSSQDQINGYTLFNPSHSALFNNDGEETLVIPSIRNTFTNWNYGNYFTIKMLVDDQNVEATDVTDGTFSILAPNTVTTPTVRVISPNGGEVYQVGQPITVTWATTGLSSNAIVHVDLSVKDSSGNYTNTSAFLTSNPTANDGIQTFTIPSNIQPGNNYDIRIDAGEPGPSYQMSADHSDNTFTIQATDGGKPAPTAVDTGCNGSRYSSTTGKLCTNYVVNTSNPVTPVVQTEGSSVSFTRTLKVGSRGDDVKRLQQILGITADGVYGKGTALKVKFWQLSKGLKADGSFGAASRSKITTK